MLLSHNILHLLVLLNLHLMIESGSIIFKSTYHWFLHYCIIIILRKQTAKPASLLGRLTIIFLVTPIFHFKILIDFRILYKLIILSRNIFLIIFIDQYFDTVFEILNFLILTYLLILFRYWWRWFGDFHGFIIPDFRNYTLIDWILMTDF